MDFQKNWNLALFHEENDDNNTENITTEEDLRKIGEKLDGLDINLDDIINELEL